MMVTPDAATVRRLVDERYDIGLALEWFPTWGGGVSIRAAGVKELSALSGVNDRTIYRIMRGERTSYYTLDALAAVLSVNTDRLVSGDVPEVTDAMVYQSKRRERRRAAVA